MLLVRWRAGPELRWRRQRKEPAWVVGEHRHVLFVALGCLERFEAPATGSDSTDPVNSNELVSAFRS